MVLVVLMMTALLWISDMHCDDDHEEAMVSVCLRHLIDSCHGVVLYVAGTGVPLFQEQFLEDTLGTAPAYHIESTPPSQHPAHANILPVHTHACSPTGDVRCQ